jgi:hypothetical protein
MNVAFKEPKPSFRSLDAIAEALLLPTGIDGVYARTGDLRDSRRRVDALISRTASREPKCLRFPPVMSRRQVEKSGYLKSFPHFLGCVCCSTAKGKRDRASGRALRGGRDWTPALSAADLVLSPPPAIRSIRWWRAAATCRPRGCCSTSPATASGASRRKMLDRLQSFRMREYVCIGTPEQIDDFRRAGWRREGFAGQLGLRLPHRAGERSVLRPRRQADGDEPGRAGVEIRAAGAGALGGASRPPA